MSRVDQERVVLARALLTELYNGTKGETCISGTYAHDDDTGWAAWRNDGEWCQSAIDALVALAEAVNWKPKSL